MRSTLRTYVLSTCKKSRSYDFEQQNIQNAHMSRPTKRFYLANIGRIL